MATQAGVQSRLFLIYGTTAYCSACGRAALIGASGAHPGSSLAQPGRPLRCRMPISLHVEKHFLSPALVRDIVIGMADGLTVPFALAAGLPALFLRPQSLSPRSWPRSRQARSPWRLAAILPRSPISNTINPNNSARSMRSHKCPKPSAPKCGIYCASTGLHPTSPKP
jgi:hypothetical protein